MRVFLLLALLPTLSFAQLNTTSKRDSSLANMDAVNNRPLRTIGASSIALGGYVDANAAYVVEDGVDEGMSFQMRRMTLFVSSGIGKHLRFMSELEFEEGTEEISLEYAALDAEFAPQLNLRGGIILNPIGSFNQNHDSPRWNFIDRPLEATTILPATMSTPGFGLYGKFFKADWIFGYETYLTNGFDGHIIDNEEGRTYLKAGIEDMERFDESNSGIPMFTGKFTLRNRKIGEIGISYLSNVYNKWREDGVVIDDKRRAKVMAIDFNTTLIPGKLTLNAEASQVKVDLPEAYPDQYADKQWGWFADLNYTFFEGRIADWEKAKLELGLRYDYVDYNAGSFSTGGNIAHDINETTIALAMRPVGNTVFRFNYGYAKSTDMSGGTTSNRAKYLLGIASYF